MFPINKIPYIRTSFAISYLPKKPKDKRKSLENYFRLFKKSEENIEDNEFFSPFFCENEIISMPENYGIRKSALEEIYNYIKNKTCLELDFRYDFRFVPPNVSYYMEDDFKKKKTIVENIAKECGLIIGVGVSHLEQIGAKDSIKPEHYHFILCFNDNSIFNFNGDIIAEISKRILSFV